MSNENCTVQQKYIKAFSDVMIGRSFTASGLFGKDNGVSVKCQHITNPEKSDNNDTPVCIWEIEMPLLHYQVSIIVDETFYQLNSDDDKCYFIVETTETMTKSWRKSKINKTRVQHHLSFNELNECIGTFRYYINECLTNAKNEYIRSHFYQQYNHLLSGAILSDPEIKLVNEFEATRVEDEIHQIRYNTQLEIKGKHYRLLLAFMVNLKGGKINLLGVCHGDAIIPISTREEFDAYIELCHIPDGNITVGKYLLEVPLNQVFSRRFAIPKDKSTFHLRLVDNSQTLLKGYRVCVHPVKVDDDDKQPKVITVEVIKEQEKSGTLRYQENLFLRNEPINLVEQLEQVLPEWLDETLHRYFIEK